jgi:hypothetical protein
MMGIRGVARPQLPDVGDALNRDGKNIICLPSAAGQRSSCALLQLLSVWPAKFTPRAVFDQSFMRPRSIKPIERVGLV